jgi:predicted RNase H-like HicB family nuclease
MEDKIITLPIIIKRTDDSDYPYFIKIPDVDGMTEGKDITDTKNMATNYIGTYSLRP